MILAVYAGINFRKTQLFLDFNILLSHVKQGFHKQRHRHFTTFCAPQLGDLCLSLSIQASIPKWSWHMLKRDYWTRCSIGCFS